MNGIIYFDNAATTYPKPEQVYSTMDISYREMGFNAGRGQYKHSRRVNIVISDARKMLLSLFSERTDKKVVFSASATEAMNIVLQGFHYSEAQNVYITHFEHNAILRTLHYLKKIHNFDIHYLKIDPHSFEYDIEDIKISFQNSPPALIIMNHVSNVSGIVTPIKKIAEMGKQYNATIVVDSAQSAGIVDIDIESMMIDYIIFAGHKTLYGPFGVGGFICNENSKLNPLIYGGTGSDSANLELPKTIPEKFEVGSPNIQAIAGLHAALKWIKEIGIDTIRKKELEIVASVIDCLTEFSDIKIKGKGKAQSVGIISFTFDGYSPDNIGRILSDNDIAVRTGLHCAPDAHRFIRTFPSGTVRISTGFFNSGEDVQKLHNVLKYIYDNG